MLNKIFYFLDLFLPKQISERVELATHFRARSIVAANFLCIFIIFLLFVGSTLLNVSLFVRIGILSCLITLATLILFLKTRTHDFEVSLARGAFIQLFILYFVVYTSSFSAKGPGFFGLIWLAPLGLLTTFYFKPIFSLILFIINMIIVGLFINIYNDSFFLPIQTIVNFKEVFLLHLLLVICIVFFLSYLFIELNGQLKDELTKQKSLLLESAKFQSLGQMSSNLAHDINGPLFTIQGKIHQIRNLLSQDQLDLEKCDNIIDNVEGVILKLSQMVKGISTFARQGHSDQMESISLDELFKGIFLLAADRINQTGISFEVKVPLGLRVICYPAYISRVVINLLNNAIDALENADMKLILVEVFAGNKWIEIHIKDSGAGVDPAIESKIFSSMFTTKKYGKGTGLGLSISKGLVEIHEGTLKYQRVGNMTDFVVRLPIYDE